MHSLCRAFAVSTLALSLTGSLALAQDRDNHDHDRDHHDNHHYVHHNDWRKGHHINHDDWNRGERVEDWHAHHLRRPPAGYEYRYVDGNYVLARPDNGLIFSVTIGH
ncbi:MAG TPA: RcnB family protein [Acidobacteriaceae bacterium]|nr:RcnB family protein [Acidobacteriaceae bacterium]